MGNVKSIKKNKNCHQLVAAYRVSELAESSPSLSNEESAPIA